MYTANSQICYDLRYCVGILKARSPVFENWLNSIQSTSKPPTRPSLCLSTRNCSTGLKGKGTFVAETTPAREKHAIIGFVITDIINPYFAHLAQAIQEMAHEQNITVFVDTNHSSTDRLKQILNTYRRRNVQLVIVHGGVVRHASALDALSDSGFPLVGIHTHLQTIDDVWPDVRSGAQLATEHLIAQCGVNIGLVSGSDDPVRETGRFEGFRDAIHSHGESVDFRYVVGTEPTYRGGHQAVLDMLDQDGLPKGLLFYNQIMAMGGVSALLSRGIQVPGRYRHRQH